MVRGASICSAGSVFRGLPGTGRPHIHKHLTRCRRRSAFCGFSARSNTPRFGSGPPLDTPPGVGSKEVMRCADRLCSHLFFGRSQGPAKVIQSRRGQRFRRVFFSPWWGFSPAGAFCCHAPPSGPLCVSPPWRLCAAFSFSGCNFTRLYFSFVLWLSCGVACRLRLACVGVWRFPWPSVGRSRGGWACISGRRCSRLGASGAAVGGPGPGMAGGGPGVFGVGRPIFCGGLPDRSARASGGASACAKVAEAKSRPRQPFSRSAGLNYSRWGKSCHCFCSRKSLGLIRPFRRQL